MSEAGKRLIESAEQALAWDSEQPNELWIGHRNEANEQLIRDPALLGPGAEPYAAYPGGHNEGFADTFKQCFRAFYASVLDPAGPVPYPTFEEGHREILLCEAILASHREERWVTLPASPG